MSDTTSRQTAIGELRTLLGERLDTSDATRDAHAKDVCHHPPHPPDAVAYPLNNEETAEILKICHRTRTPVIPFGVGTGVEGGVVAIHGGVAVDTSRMKQVLRVDAINRDATVQAGVTRFQLNDYLRDNQTDLHFSVDPGADATLGGMAATCASGSATVGYGTMRDNVLGLTAVDAQGRVLRTGGRARKSSAGYDLTRLLVGSEGTLALITEVTVRLHRVPAAVTSAVCGLPDIDSAVNAAIEMLTAELRPARLELLDATLVDAVNRYSDCDYRVTPTLCLEFHGEETSVAKRAEQAGAIAAAHGADDFRWAAEAEQRARLWRARYDAYYACLALRPDSVGYVSDVCVPISRLAESIRHAQQLLRSTTIPAPLFGHVGDGNFHVVFLIRPGDDKELAEVQGINRQIVAKALELEGTCTGEHGVGLGKIDMLRDEFGAAVDVMRAIKQAWDPHGIMNPGKIFGDVD